MRKPIVMLVISIVAKELEVQRLKFFHLFIELVQNFLKILKLTYLIIKKKYNFHHCALFVIP